MQADISLVRADYQGGSKMPAYTCYVHVLVHLHLYIYTWVPGKVVRCVFVIILTCTRVHVNHISLACTSTYTSILIVLFYDLYINYT